jgi:TPR repeat protein
MNLLVGRRRILTPIFGYVGRFCSRHQVTPAVAPRATGRDNLRGILRFELFLALSLAVCYYFLVRVYASGVENNSTNYWVFSSCSISNFHLGDLYEVWKGRIAGLILSGSLFDFLLKGNSIDPERYAAAFGLYQGVWLLLLLLLITWSLQKSLLINLGIFAGLMYNFSPVAGLYFYPWDIPATFFFTLAVLLFEREEILWAAAVTCIGCFFKETVLVAAILCLFAKNWNWGKRAVLFLGIIAFYVWGKRLMLEWLGVNGAVFSMGDARNVKQLLQTHIASENLRTLLSPTLNQVVFANAGTVVAVLLLGWRRRFHPYTLLILAFVAGNFVYGAFTEFRVFMQILPLSWMILVGLWSGSSKHSEGALVQDTLKSASKTATPDEAAQSFRAWDSRGSTPRLVLFSAFLVVISIGVLGWRFFEVAQSRSPAHRERALRELLNQGRSGNASAQLELGMRYLRGDGFEINPTQALGWIRRAADQGEPRAECELGLLYSAGENLPKNYSASFEWLHKAALQRDAEAEYGLGCFYEKGLGTHQDPLEAALWYERAAEHGHVRAQLNLGLLLCVVRHEYAQAEVWLRKAAEEGNAEAQLSLGRLYRGAPGIKPNGAEAYKWLKLAQLQGLDKGEEDLRSCVASLSPTEIKQSEALVQTYLSKHR